MSRTHAALAPRPLGGKLFTRPVLVLGALSALGMLLIVWRFAVGLGRTTGLSDGYPWGLWIAWDDVTGTGLACGGFAVAIVVYVLNRGKYHPLMRPAILGSALGYTMAAIGVVVDVGRPWNMWRVAQVWRWNLYSPLLMVALCIMVYVLLLWIELLPALLEVTVESKRPWLRTWSKRLQRPLDLALPWILAAGLVLPMMHQSALGTMMVVARTKLHPLWHTPLLPLLFLLSTLGMGYAIEILESAIAGIVVGRQHEKKILGSLSRVIAPVAAAWVVIRFADLALRGRLGLVFGSGHLSVFFWLEIALTLLPALMLLPAGGRTTLSVQFRAAVLLLLAGALYRFDVYLVGFNPGAGWGYFPTVIELMVTTGIVATEVLGYVLFVKRFPILLGEVRPVARGVQ